MPFSPLLLELELELGLLWVREWEREEEGCLSAERRRVNEEFEEEDGVDIVGESDESEDGVDSVGVSGRSCSNNIDISML